MKKTVVEFSEERFIIPSGLSLVGAMLGKSEFAKKCNRMSVSKKCSLSLGISYAIPSAETLRQRMDDIGFSL